ncbi:MAG: 30S ribosomal protein S12 methylthiotransferase RimO [SAR324 cluster bacterium]|uniref:Ribosomal protein uS12 methylthiotransferase RimO n=1 Tax=SAR324 cluster bacterium TaxID=2024889 RepID=A0A7X9FPZ6_9DELT|nr:30S ribosomal protein S12 methylthiotransferase RimO [SAR324 cluster bacterium]
MSRFRIIENSKFQTKARGIQKSVSDTRDIRKKYFQGNAALVTLGCAKNQVDSEVMLGVLQANGFSIVNNLSEADVVVVNTCGFLQSAVKESIDCILEVASYKKQGRLRKLIVAGCLVERYKKGIEKALPEVDAFIDTRQIISVADAATGSFFGLLQTAARPYFLYDDATPRVFESEFGYAYVKISEGCNRHCAFCMIPKIRGKMRSRTVSSIKKELRQLAANGIKEVNLIAQDLTSFAKDRGEKNGLLNLLRELDALKIIPWIRLLYLYPSGINKELLLEIESLASICNYIDLPLQHVNERILKSMNRPVARFAPRRIVELIEKTSPNIALRSTFIVGYPGERERDLIELETFVREGHFSSLGVFPYSREEGSAPFNLKDQLPSYEKGRRVEFIMKAQQDVLAKRLATYVGKTIEVLVEGYHQETELLLSARSRFQAPEVDGKVLINDLGQSLQVPKPGSFRNVQISGVLGYDLVGCLLETNEII